MSRVVATAPAKLILFGEHAVNRGAVALAVGVGLRARCAIDDAPPDGAGIMLRSGTATQRTTRAAIHDHGRVIDRLREHADFNSIARLAGDDYFAPAKYVLAAAGADLPEALDIQFESAVPGSAGLGSGGAAFAALTTALLSLLGRTDDFALAARWAQRGDIVAHGGVASGLDTQTALLGGAIRYAADQLAAPAACAPGLTLVIGNTGISAPTSVVNGRVRAWLAEQPTRLHYFREIGLLARTGELALAHGDWGELGQLMNLNQLVLERIGVSTPELERLNAAALAAGAFGAKLTGSGGGGSMIALVDITYRDAVAQAIQGAGGTPICVSVGVPGAQIEPQSIPL